MNMCSTIHALSPLPLELWLTIFDLATDVPGLLSSDGPAPSDLPRSLVEKQEVRLLKESLSIKRTIVCVCKTWHVLATKFLYRSVLITRTTSFPSLLSTLSRRSSGETHSNLVGWWTRRLDISISSRKDLCQISHYLLLANIIQQLPNLSTITLQMWWDPSGYCGRDLHYLTPVIMALAGTCGPSLRVFDCSGPIFELHPLV